MLEQRLAKMEKILLSPTSKATTEDTDEDTEENVLVADASIPVKRASEDNNNNHDCASPTSYSSISSNFPSPPAHVLTHQLLLRPDTNDLLPSMDMTEHIIDLYFKYLFITLPIFDERTLRNDVKERKCPDFLLFSLFGACARFSERPGIKENPAWRSGEKYAEKARSMLIKAMDEPNISNLQALTLLTLHEYGCGRGPRSWMYGGMAARMAMELGLHEDPEDQTDNNSVEYLITQETHRRLFWTIFTIDKYSSAATGKPASFQDSFCTAFLPAMTDRCNSEQYYTETLDNSRYVLLNVNGLRDSQLLGSLSLVNGTSVSSPPPGSRRPPLNCFAYLIRATSILGKVTTYVNKKGKATSNTLPPYHADSEFSQLDKTIEDLHEQLPMHLKNTPANFESYKESIYAHDNRQFILLHILHNTLRVLLHRPSLVLADTLDSDVVNPELKEFVRKSVDKCMAAVDNVTIFINEIGTQMELVQPFLTYLTYTVATVVVSTSFSPHAEEAQKAKQALGVYFRLLLAAREYWAMADKLYFMIRDLYAIHNNVMSRRTPQPNAQEAMHQQQQEMVQRHLQQQLLQQQLQFQQQNNSASTLGGNWDQSFYNSALIGGNSSEFDFNFNTRTNDLSSTNIFQLPEGYSQPLMFSSTTPTPTTPTTTTTTTTTTTSNPDINSGS
ncbi:fungal-specific transcription factor domain-containing protein [Thamnidium elegans]|nr:fungal-specific transcription factor domain-containing protein [Thamnidium elegans]